LGEVWIEGEHSKEELEGVLLKVEDQESDDAHARPTGDQQNDVFKCAELFGNDQENIERSLDNPLENYIQTENIEMDSDQDSMSSVHTPEYVPNFFSSSEEESSDDPDSMSPVHTPKYVPSFFSSSEEESSNDQNEPSSQ